MLNSQRNVLEVFIYFDEKGVPKRKDDLALVLSQVSEEYKNIFGVEFKYSFENCGFLTPFDVNAYKNIEELRKSMTSAPKTIMNNISDSIKKTQDSINTYSIMSIEKKQMTDFYRYVSDKSDKKNGIHCLLRSRGIFLSDRVSHGFAIVGEPYCTVNANDSNFKVKRRFLHEFGHCFGAKHSSNYFSIMYPYGKLPFWIWDKESKSIIADGIEKFLADTTQ